MQNVYEVYIDSLFLIHFIMNLYFYTLAAKTLKRTATRVRILIGSGAAAVLFTVLLLIPGLPLIMKRFVGPIAVSMVMTAVIFRIKSIETVFRTTGYMFVYAFAFGGIMKFLFESVPYLADRKKNIWYILGAGMLGYQVISWGIRQVGRKKDRVICKVRLKGYENQLELNALIDTGNSLKEPISGKPVSVIEEDAFRKLQEVKIEEKLKMIPYHSIGKNNGMLEGYEIPEMIIESEEGSIQWQKVIVGISKNRISASGKYQMILHPDLYNETFLKKTDNI